jgi:hypothetical protein
LGYDLARCFVDDLVIIPGALGCLISGLLISLFTPWGFFKHRWVAVKLLLTVACILYGTFYLGPPVNAQPGLTRELGLAAESSPQYQANRQKNLIGGGVQLGALLFMVAISTLKPWPKRRGEALEKKRARPEEEA